MWACDQGELALIQLYMYACMCVWCIFNYHRVALIRKYMYGYTYMEVFSCNLEPRFIFCIFNCGAGLKWNSCAGTLTSKCGLRYIRENICMPPCMSLEIVFPKFVRTYGMCMHHDKLLFHTCIVPPLINLLLGYVTLIHYDLVSRELHHVVGTDGSTSWKWEFPIDVWYSCPTLESLALYRVLQTAPLLLEWSIPGGTTMVWNVGDHTSS